MLTHVEKINTLISLSEALKGHNVRIEIGTKINIWFNRTDDYPDVQTTNVEDVSGHLLQHGERSC